MNANESEIQPSANPLKIPTMIGMLLLAVMIILPLFMDVHHHGPESPGETPNTLIEAASPTAVEVTEPEHSVPDHWMIGTIPFVCLLLSIAILPLIPFTHHNLSLSIG